MHQGPLFSALDSPEGRHRRAQLLHSRILKEVTIVGSWDSDLCKVLWAAVGVAQHRHPLSILLEMVVWTNLSRVSLSGEAAAWQRQLQERKA